MENSLLAVRPARMSDAQALAPRLREADRMEIRARSGADPRVALESGIRRSRPCCALLDDAGQVLALFGVSPYPGIAAFGVVWMLGSDALVARRAMFLRTAKFCIAQLHRRYPMLGNVIDARNTVHIRWLQWMGFEMLQRVECFGVEQRPFIAFRRVSAQLQAQATAAAREAPAPAAASAS